MNSEELESQRSLFIQLARDIAAKSIAPRAESIDSQHAFPKDVATVLAKAGFLSFAVPTEYGGIGGDVRLLASLCEVLAAADVSSTMIFTVQSTCTEVIKALADDEQKKRLFGRVNEGGLLALALTEPEAGSDSASIRLSATRDGDHYVLDGMKRYITNGEVADMLVTFAVTDPGKRQSGISTFIVDNPSQGLSFTRNERKMGLHGTTTNEIVFENVKVPLSNRLGEENAGFGAAMRALEKGRVAIAAVAVGLAQGALNEAVEFARVREQFGHKIGTFQGLQFKLADMATGICAARELVARAAALADEGDSRFGSTSAMAKLFATDVAMQVTTEAVQVHGGSGYIEGTPVERMMRDAKILQIFEGTNEIMRVIVARDLLGRIN